MTRWLSFLKIVLTAVIMSLVSIDAIAQNPQDSAELRQALANIRASQDEEARDRFEKQLLALVLRLDASEFDSGTIEEIVSMAGPREPTHLHGPLTQALGHIGSRAMELIIVKANIETSKDFKLALLTELELVTRDVDRSKIPSATIDKIAAFLDNRDYGTYVKAAEILGDIGPPARQYLPALERTLQRATAEEAPSKLILGTLGSLIVEIAIRHVAFPPPLHP